MDLTADLAQTTARDAVPGLPEEEDLAAEDEDMDMDEEEDMPGAQSPRPQGASRGRDAEALEEEVDEEDEEEEDEDEDEEDDDDDETTLEEDDREVGEEEEDGDEQEEREEEDDAPLGSQEPADEAEACEDDDEGDENAAAEAKLRRREALAEFLQLEQRFAELRTEVFHEKMLGLAEETVLLQLGRHRDFLASKRDLEGKLNQRKHVAAVWLELSQEAYAKQLEMKRYQADCTYEARKAQLRATLIADREAKRYQLMREKRLLDHPPAVLSKRRREDKAGFFEMSKLQREYGRFPAPAVREISGPALEEDLLQLGLLKSRNPLSAKPPIFPAAQVRNAKRQKREEWPQDTKGGGGPAQCLAARLA